MVGIDSQGADTLEFWAQTGRSEIVYDNGNGITGGTLIDIGDWIIQRLGSDVDADRVVDDRDNCAPIRCARRGLPLSDCANSSQSDEDGDGVGDLCDNCPSHLCLDMEKGLGAPFAGRFTCRNLDDPWLFGDQADRDADGIGDACDLCPERARSHGNGLGAVVQHYDENNNLVGDECDKSCPSVPGEERELESFPLCLTNADCPRRDSTSRAGTRRAFPCADRRSPGLHG